MLSSTAFADRYLNRPGWRLTFQDEFTGGTLKTSKWSAQDAPNYANEELQYYTPECAVVTNDNLVLVSKNEGVWDGSHWWSYKSGKVVTAHKFDQQYGRFEVRAKLPAGKGFWPAHWMLGYNGWPPEIDFMELIGSVPWRVTVGYHWGPAPPPPLYPWDVGQTANRDIWAGDWTLDYHTFACEWDWWGIKFYIDDGEVFASYRNVPHEPMYLILNTAVGGQWPGAPDWTTPWPAEHKIDYARVYERYAGSSALNDSFEAGEEGTLADWNMLESGNITPDPAPARARTGSRSAALTGRFNGQPNGSYLFQSLSAAENEIWQAGVWVHHRPDDPLQGSNTVQLKLEFLDGFGVFQAQPTRTIAVSNTPSGYTHYAIRARAPVWTTHARVTVAFQQYADAPGTVNVDDAQLTRITLDGARALANGGYEDEEAGWPVSWVRFGTVSNALAVTAPGQAHEGNGLLRLAPATNLTGVLQDLPAQAGEPWTATLWARSRPDDPLTGGDVVRAKLEFVNSSLQVIGAHTQLAASAASATNFTNLVLSAGAPVGTAYARLVVERVPAGGGGQAEIDDATLSTSADPTSLLDADFEQANSTNIPGWTRYGAGTNVRRDVNAAHARSGTNAVQVFGQFSGGQNESGLFQDLDASPGEVWEASVWARNRPGDLLQGANRAYLKIEFRDSGDALLDSDVADAAASNSPTVYQRVVVRRAAPPGTARVRLVLALVQQNNAGGSVNFDDTELRRMTVNELRSILNGDFEMSEGTRVVNWNRYPTQAGNVLRDPVAAHALGGTAAVQMYGQFAGDPNFSGLFQDLPAQAGEPWQAEVWARNRPGDGAQGQNRARLKLEFVDLQNVTLATHLYTVITASSSTNYARFQLRHAAPSGTQRARIVLEYRQAGSANGSVNFDNAALAPVTALDAPGLLNGGFEEGAAQEFPSWAMPVAGFLHDPVAANARSGSRALQMYGTSTGAVTHVRLWQDVPMLEGQLCQAAVWARNRPTDGLQGGSVANLHLQFLGAGGQVVTGLQVKVADAATSTNYARFALVRPAPAGAVAARLLLELVQDGASPGSVNFDDAALAPLPALTGAQGAGRIGWAGELSPGVGEPVTVDQDLFLDASTALEMFVGGLQAGTNHDQVVAGNQVTLNGGLTIRLPSGASGQGSSLPFVPRPGQSFELLRMGTRSGQFAWMDAPDGLGGPAFTLDYSTTNVVLRVIREVDSDEDGLPDFWEVEHFGSRQSADAVTDTDQDGQPNVDEFVSETVPTNGASFFEVSGGAAMGAGVLQFQASPSSTGRLYDVYWRSNLADSATWQPYGLSRPGSGGDLSLLVTNPLPDGFFRAGVRVP